MYSIHGIAHCVIKILDTGKHETLLTKNFKEFKSKAEKLNLSNESLGRLYRGGSEQLLCTASYYVFILYFRSEQLMIYLIAYRDACSPCI